MTSQLIDLKVLNEVVDRLNLGYKSEEVAAVFGEDAVKAGQQYIQDNPPQNNQDPLPVESEADRAEKQALREENVALRGKVGQLDDENKNLRMELRDAQASLQAKDITITDLNKKLSAFEQSAQDNEAQAKPKRGRPPKTAA